MALKSKSLGAISFLRADSQIYTTLANISPLPVSLVS
jgi:hypothetical protein